MGKYYTYNYPYQQAQQQQQPTRPQSTVSLGKVITEPELVERSLRLETSLANANMTEFCESKIGGCENTEDQQGPDPIEKKIV